MVVPACFCSKRRFAFSVRSWRSLAPHQNMRSRISSAKAGAQPSAAAPAAAAVDVINARREILAVLIASSSFPLLLGALGALAVNLSLIRQDAKSPRRA